MRKPFLLLLALLGCRALLAQTKLPCYTDERTREMLQHYPRHDHTLPSGNAVSHPAARTTASTPDTALLIVPTVIHVVHDYGWENIPDDTLFEWVKRWNEALLGHNSDTSAVISTFKPYIGNARIQLKLATSDPWGMPTKGIDRVQHYLTTDGDDYAKFNQWPQNMYANVWLVRSITGGSAYSRFPYMVSDEPYYDGIISYASAAGYAQIIPHEFGHYFDLHHIWGDTYCGVACGWTDSVDDTPPTKGHMVTSCVPSSLYDTNCATGYLVHYTSSLGVDSIYDYPDTANAQNIMDYTNCDRMFTKGQAARMRDALHNVSSTRNNLILNSNLAATGALSPMPNLPPVADFIVNKAVFGASDSRSYFLTYNGTGTFQFRNASWNDTITSVLWTFPAGATTPTSSSMTTVDNQFSSPGWVAVSLTANSNAGSSTITKSHAVYAADPTPVGSVGYEQNFASETSLSNWPFFNYFDNQFKWKFYGDAGIDDNSCFMYRSYDTTSLLALPRQTGIAPGDMDDLYTPAFNLAGVASDLFLNFYTTGAATYVGIPSWEPYRPDSLEIDISTSGGLRWNKLADFSGYDLCWYGMLTHEFLLSSTSIWLPHSVKIPALYRDASTFFRFRYKPGNMGNNMYLDKLSLNTAPASVNQIAATGNESFDIIPNPSANGCNLVFVTRSDGKVSYSIKDVTGKIVYEDVGDYAPNSVQHEAISRQAVPAAGMYFVTLNTGGTTAVRKMVVY